MGVKDIFSKVSCFILSVKTFKERIESVNRQLAPLGIPYQFIFKHDITDFASEPLPVSFRKPLVLTLPEQSIVGKHVEAWHQGLNSGREYALVLEDDAILDTDFIQKLETILSEIEKLSPGFLVNLGGANSRVPQELYRDKHFFYRFRMETSEGYISDRLAMERRLSWLKENLVDRSADHMIRHIDAQVGTDHWWPKEAIVEQGSLFGAFESSLDKGRASRIPSLLKLSYESKKFRRRTLKRWIAYVF